MTVQLNQGASREQEVVYYPAVNGRCGRVFATLLLGLLTVALLWLPFLALNQLLVFTGFGFIRSFQDPDVPWLPTAALFILHTSWALLCGWFTARFAVHGVRSARGRWWLRLTSRGFEVNDRLFRPRRRQWSEIDEFVLVTVYDHTEAAVPAAAKTFADAVKDGDTWTSGWIVGYHYSPGHRRTLPNRLWRIVSGPRDREGTKADGIVMGYWDRPFDEAVDLMNAWLTRYKAA